MQELLLAVARGLVEDKDAVKVTVDEPREDGTIPRPVWQPYKAWHPALLYRAPRLLRLYGQ